MHAHASTHVRTYTQTHVRTRMYGHTRERIATYKFFSLLCFHRNGVRVFLSQFQSADDFALDATRPIAPSRCCHALAILVITLKTLRWNLLKLSDNGGVIWVYL